MFDKFSLYSHENLTSNNMEYSLIANSGIQFYKTDIAINLNSMSKHLFHEWFDEELVETNLEFAYQLPESMKVVRLSELEECHFISKDGRLIVSEEEVLSNPNLEILFDGDIHDAEDIFSMKLSDKRCKIDKMLGQWLPLPMFELDFLGDFKAGPYNWCRCKIIPKEEEPQNGIIEADVLFAFDTRALYEEVDEYAECPVFVSDTEKSKRFKLCDRVSRLLDFCSGKNSWIRGYLMNLVHGVTEIEDIRIDSKEREYKYAFLSTYLLIIEYLSKHLALPDFRLVRDRDVSNIGVEMIIDIGNSRTAAILFEDGDFTRVKPLRLQNFTFPIKDGELNRKEDTFDMRLAFQKVSFGEHTMAGSNQFVWPSIVRLGSEAEYLTHETTNLAEGDEILSTYSSPKRYLWDRKARREEWRCVRTSAEGRNEEPLIEGISNYFSDNGEIDKDGFGFGLHYSRKTLMTLAFMEILSQAKVQINGYEYREFNGKITTPRRIDKIILTCPTAMSKNEQLSLHGSLKDALFVLNKFSSNIDHTSTPIDIKVVPELKKNTDDTPQWIFDEATCSQFVYLYGQFCHTYLNSSQEFFNLYGRKRQSEDGEMKDSLVIGSLDIGAGTSDIMVCKYEYNPHNTSRLKPLPVFWDSFDFAGDDMLHVLISNALLQGTNGIMERKLRETGVEETDIRRKLYQFFGEDNAQLSFRDRILRRDFNLQVLVPVMYHFLQLLSEDVMYREVPFQTIFQENMPSEYVLDKFSQKFGFQLSDIRWIYDSEVMTRIIERTMTPMLENAATVMYAHGCDIVLLSGRPASLRPIKDIFLKYFAVSPHRLIVLNKFRIGTWYPFSDEYGYLSNSKSVVPVGAMIGHLASSAGGFNNFSLDLTELGKRLKPTTEYFIVKDVLVSSNKSFITPRQNTGEITANSFPLYIGSCQFDVRHYPVRPFYVLDINKDSIADRFLRKYDAQGQKLTDSNLQYLVREYSDSIMSKAPLTFTLTRDDYEENKEILTIDSVRGTDGEDLNTGDFLLSVQSLNDPECYWLDSGVFNINIKSN